MSLNCNNFETLAKPQIYTLKTADKHSFFLPWILLADKSLQLVCKIIQNSSNQLIMHMEESSLVYSSSTQYWQ